MKYSEKRDQRIYKVAWLAIVTFVVNLLFLVNHHIVNSDALFKAAPVTVQHLDDSYILDVAVSGCIAYNKRNPDCGKPKSQDGKFGDISEFQGGWVSLDKDLCLGLSWFRKEKLWVKKINHDNYQKLAEKTKADAVVVDIAVDEDGESTKRGWEYRSNGVWIKYGPHDRNEAVTEINVLFGQDAVDPRPNWSFVDTSIKNVCNIVGYAAYLSFRRGPKLDYKKVFNKPLKMNDNNEFKILQVADLHFSTGVGVCFNAEPPSSTIGCRADPRTLKFINKILDIEQPDLVVLSGDQVFGYTAPDTETAALKAYSPFIERKIPFAAVLGNHDAEGSLPAKELMQLFADLPYSVGVVGPESIDGYGNYLTTVQGNSNTSVALAFYFIDSHDYSQNKEEYPGYDWIKQSQLDYMKEEARFIKDGIAEFEKEKVKQDGQIKTKKHLSMAFFHIPLPEFKNTTETLVGTRMEDSGSPLYNSGARDAFQELGVKAISIGHDHCNDYCLLDKRKSSPTEENQIWLCYAGGVGLGGYGCSGYERRTRTYVFNTAKGEIKSWKRAENEPEEKIDEQVLVSGGAIGNWF
ncbi:hypothetical protein KGF57_004451 [Candida theae]|uniref:Calcineurin-like phosphoesterase domain-containing protein n=1 Tax=Candida theae TaxID=1198502 RepID=A0AAD5BBX8_9ASCO|nr:uncharacterized protein KGF57_004451 [Candida theae]KAI5949941.1 hypothetical protein KGF57_004451 [Candida theae]